jgi:UDP-glucose 4-epimerase
MTRILVTGGAGFIGSHLCDYFAEGGNVVAAVDNLSLGKESNISHLLGKNNFRFYKQDLLNLVQMAGIFEKEKFEEVYHLAANSDIAQSGKNPDVDMNNTLMTTYSILKLMKQYKVGKIIFSSSSAIYGETKNRILENFGPLFPLSHYGAAKLSSEAFISSFAENYNLQAWILRFPNVIGPRATHGVLFDLINKIKNNPAQIEVLGDGEQNKPYLYVKDLIDAIVFVRHNSHKKINVFNIGVESRTKVKTIAKMIIDQLNLKTSIRYTGGDRGWVGDVPAFEYDLTEINKLGWKAKYSSDGAVRMSIKELISE